MTRTLFICIFLINGIFNLAMAAPLQVEGPHQQTKTYQRNELSQFGIHHISMNYSRAYPKQNMNYRTIRFCDLLSSWHLTGQETIELISTDQFSVLVPARYLLNCKAQDSIAYLAIEPKSKWPILFNGTHTTAGPYSVIWTNPKWSYISDEYWAWSVNKVKILKPQSHATAIAPPKLAKTAKNHAVLNGYKQYISHCASCHTINHIGKASIGPDLTPPHSPLDLYPNHKNLMKFIRDPAAMRYPKPTRMSGSTKTGLHDDDLKDLIAYFNYMKNKHQGSISAK